MIYQCHPINGAPISEINLSSPTTTSTSTLSTSSTIIMPTVASVQILSTCQSGQYFKRDCKLYISCENGKWRRNFCPENKYWNQIAKKCDDIHNVPECYEMFLEIQRNVRSMMQAKRSSPSIINEHNNMEAIESSQLKPSPTTAEMKSKNDHHVEFDEEYEEEEDDDDENNDEDDNGDDDNSMVNPEPDHHHDEQKSKLVTKILEKPYFSSKDYEDYDDDDDDFGEEEEEEMKTSTNNNHPKEIKLSSSSSNPTKRSHHDETISKNDIITIDDNNKNNDRMMMVNKRKKSKSNYQQQQQQSSTITPSTLAKNYGKICIIRGKQIECHESNDNVGDGTTIMTTTTIPESESITTTTATEINESGNKCGKQLSSNNDIDDQRKIHSYSLKIEINIDDRIFIRIERFIRLIIYYISFQFM
ncbi:chitin binding [Dermatophagoides pteronyssinus]|uniref:Chitin binding n=1 Tax=Dermatophagoides pteronyssinus TaxID=6956 RepID=A0ABQ8J3W8_DERPT|nr:chitin binding [Dermatophagoides pteronyssinus]